MDRDALIDELKQVSASDFLETHIFDRVPRIFAENRSQYVAWKRQLAKCLEVDSACITVVGSAAVGVSLSPHKNFRAFDAHSDVDVAVISHYHFTQSWRYLRMNLTRRLSVDQRTRNAWDEHVSKYIYWGTIATDRLLGVLPFGRQWLDAKKTMAMLEPSVGRDVNLRIYVDYESLRAYQLNSIKQAHESLFT